MADELKVTEASALRAIKPDGIWSPAPEDVHCPVCGPTDKLDELWINSDGKRFWCDGCCEEYADPAHAPPSFLSEKTPTLGEALREDEAKIVARAMAKVNGKDEKSWEFKSDSYGKSMGFTFSKCDHPPKKVIEPKDKKWSVWAGKKSDVRRKAHTFSVVLNLTGLSIKKRHYFPIAELKQFEDADRFHECLIEWPDYGVCNLRIDFWRKLVEYIKTNNSRALVFCEGGHGRTGTAIASMLVAMGWEPQKAIDKVREVHCKHAIETIDQEDYIIELGQKAKRGAKHGSKSI